MSEFQKIFTVLYAALAVTIIVGAVAVPAAVVVNHVPAQNTTSLHVQLEIDQAQFWNAVTDAQRLAPLDVTVTGGIVPHHRLVSPLIADFFQSVGNQQPEIVVIVGPNHADVGRAPVITSPVEWQVPGGVVKTDHRIQDDLVKQGQVAYDHENFVKEHSISELIPYVRHYFPEVTVVPLIITSKMTLAEEDRLAAYLNELQRSRPTLILASIDFSHYLDSSQAQQRDNATLKAITERDFRTIKEMNSDHLDSPAALNVLLKTMDASGAAYSKILTHTNSAEYLGVDLGETTSYFTMVFSPKRLSQKTELMFGGDVMLSRQVNAQMEKYGYTWPFENIADTLSRADITIVNLESPFSYTNQYAVPTGSFTFNANPKSVAGLQLAGVDVVSLANNHFGNMNTDGMLATFEILSDANIQYSGAGNNETEAREGTVVERNGIRFGFLSYAYPESLYVATDASPGMANMDIGKMTSDVKRMKNNADTVIVLMHAGIEYVSTPNVQQKAFARAAIDAGAELVVGHHPHWVQVTEVYKGKSIVYSLGNLVFDQMWSRETQQGALLSVVFDDFRVSSATVIPVLIEQYGQPVLADGQDREAILDRMELTSPHLTW